MTRQEPTRRPDYTLAAHNPDGTSLGAIAASANYPYLCQLLLARRAQHLPAQLLILPTKQHRRHEARLFAAAHIKGA